VRVRRNEGVAIRIGPEPCAVIREGAGEASAGDRTGQPLSRVSECLRGADAVSYVQGNTGGCVSASARPTPRGLRPWCRISPVRTHSISSVEGHLIS
jgi:hypothetical protein